MPDNEVAAKATGAENHGFLTDRMAVSQDALNSESAGPLLGFRPVVLQKPPKLGRRPSSVTLSL